MDMYVVFMIWTVMFLISGTYALYRIPEWDGRILVVDVIVALLLFPGFISLVILTTLTLAVASLDFWDNTIFNLKRRG